jgi:hypothetical protein
MRGLGGEGEETGVIGPGQRRVAARQLERTADARADDDALELGHEGGVGGVVEIRLPSGQALLVARHRAGREDRGEAVLSRQLDLKPGQRGQAAATSAVAADSRS